MKDATHHLKNIQRKVLQAVRKDTKTNHNNNHDNFSQYYEFDENAKTSPSTNNYYK